MNMPRTTHVASNQSSQLEHPSYFSNPSVMDHSNLLSLHLDTNFLPTPTRGRRRSLEPLPSPALSPTSSIPHQLPRTHTYASHFLSTLTSAPPSWPFLLLCNNDFSINQNWSNNWFHSISQKHLMSYDETDDANSEQPLLNDAPHNVQQYFADTNHTYAKKGECKNAICAFCDKSFSGCSTSRAHLWASCPWPN